MTVEQKIQISEPREVIVPVIYSCPGSIERLGEVACNGYVKIYNVLTSVDFAAMGEVAPDVAKDVVSLRTVGQLVNSTFTFSPDIDSIRTEFLVPLLTSISNLKQLSNMSREDDDYLEKTQVAYSSLLTTSFDSAIKIQKMAPEAFENMNDIALGSLLAYLGAETAGDEVISRTQPPWFKEVVAPIIREAGVLSIDLVLNGSETPLEDRLQRFMDMEQQVTAAVIRLCRQSPTANANECIEALNTPSI
ncbi:MAG: hypothetical protein HRT44_08030 [Bdellovibrionales bacterium]|nr:hypothetical protein [Bdellovibrionales bacterium]NQZ19187.1 hypothetical protein [Bdellovibrionales bacterium]